jgi:hypothetical protein
VGEPGFGRVVLCSHRRILLSQSHCCDEGRVTQARSGVKRNLR